MGTQNTQTLKLEPYQETGAATLASAKRFILADEMGLGKTAQAIDAAKRVNARKMIVVCPAFLVKNWRDELKTWNYKWPVHVISYDRLVKERAELIKREWDLCIFDEAHYLKNPRAKRTKAALGRWGLGATGVPMWFLTGTPMPKLPNDLWSMTFACGQHTMKYNDFTQYFCHVDPQWGTPLSVKNERVPEIKAMLDKCMLRRMKHEVALELPPVSLIDVNIGVPPVKVEDLDWEDEDIKAFTNLIKQGAEPDVQTLSRMGMHLMPLRRAVGLAKSKAIAPIIADELENNLYKKVVIFGWFKNACYHMFNALDKFNPILLTGDVLPDVRAKYVQDFQSFSEHRVAVCNIAAAGTGITLTAANQVVFIEADWTPANMAQAAARCHRRGQKNPVTVRHFISDNEIDKAVSRALSRKLRAEFAIFGD